jgi:hypothetical protein
MIKLATLLEISNIDRTQLEKIRKAKVGLYCILDCFGKITRAYYLDDQLRSKKYASATMEYIKKTKSLMNGITHKDMRFVKGKLEEALKCLKEFEKNPNKVDEYKSAENYFRDAFDKFHVIFAEKKREALTLYPKSGLTNK